MDVYRVTSAGYGDLEYHLYFRTQREAFANARECADDGNDATVSRDTIGEPITKARIVSLLNQRSWCSKSVTLREFPARASTPAR